jgi:hypothetical protein
MTTRAFFRTARAIATVWRCPPESDDTFCRTDFTVRTDSDRSVSDASRSICPSSKVPSLVSSRPRNMFCTMSRLSQSARSWYTTSTPSRAASRGVWRLTSTPSKSTVPASYGCTPARPLMSVDLPAPLSPTRAVTLPG